MVTKVYLTDDQMFLIFMINSMIDIFLADLVRINIESPLGTSSED
jgi:hypothetical protein